MTVKDFKKGQTVYVVFMHHGRNVEPEIMKRTVIKVGRKYVTDNQDRRYSNPYCPTNWMMEDAECGERGLLFCSEQEAKEYIEKVEIMRFIHGFRFSQIEKYSVEELRKVKEILDK